MANSGGEPHHAGLELWMARLAFAAVWVPKPVEGIAALQEVERYCTAKPVHPYPQPPLPLISGVLVAEATGECRHAVRQAQHEHGDDGHRRSFLRQDPCPAKGVG